MKQKRILTPTTNAESWRALLADPEKQWKKGYSAQSAAESWEKANGIPKEILKSFDQYECFKNSEMLLAIPEFKVPLPGGSTPSQNDLLVVTTNKTGLTLITVESKVKEDFDKTIEEWRKYCSNGKKERLKFLLETIAYPNIKIDNLRYQLFHRLASSIIMAEKFHAKKAMMIVQSFEEDDALNHFEDYKNFISSYKVVPEKEKIQQLNLDGKINGIDVYSLWVSSKMI